jgi:hypothetical protein
MKSKACETDDSDNEKEARNKRKSGRAVTSGTKKPGLVEGMMNFASPFRRFHPTVAISLPSISGELFHILASDGNELL